MKRVEAEDATVAAFALQLVVEMIGAGIVRGAIDPPLARRLIDEARAKCSGANPDEAAGVDRLAAAVHGVINDAVEHSPFATGLGGGA